MVSIVQGPWAPIRCFFDQHQNQVFGARGDENVGFFRVRILSMPFSVLRAVEGGERSRPSPNGIHCHLARHGARAGHRIDHDFLAMPRIALPPFGSRRRKFLVCRTVLPPIRTLLIDHYSPLSCPPPEPSEVVFRRRLKGPR
jgi:hypothetical protein